MAEIDSLEIKISSQVNKANASITTLIKRLDGLSASLSGVNSRGLATMGAGVNKLANAMNNFSANTKTIDFSRLSRNLKSISEIDTSKFSEISSKVTQLSVAFKGIGTIDTSGITNIATSLSRLGGKNAIAGADNLIKVGDKLGQFVTQMNGIGSLTFDATSLSSLISSISRLGGKAATEAVKNLPPISAQLQNFVRQLNNIGSLKFDTTNLSNLINGISRLGGKTAMSAVANIQTLTKELNSLIITLSRAPTINRNIIDMTNALANLARTGTNSRIAANSLSQSFTKISSTGNRTLGTLRGMQGTFRNLIRSIIPFVGVFQLFNLGKQAMEISSDLTEVQNVVDTTFDDMSYKVENLTKTSIEQFGLSELSLKQFSSRFQAMGTAMGFPINQMSDMSIELTKLTADIASFYNVAQEDVARNLQSIFTGETEPLRKYGLDLTQATLQEWALKQGIDANVQSMSQAQKTMLRYQYVLTNTKAAQGDFARTSGTWANQIRILKQNFEQLASVIGGGLINAFKPFVRTLNAVLQKVITFARIVTEALGSIFGWKYEVSSGGLVSDWGNIEDSTGGVADNLGDAAKSVKEMNKSIRAWDELNLLTTSEPSKGGGGSGGAGGAGLDLDADVSFGKIVPTDSILKDYESFIDNLHELGNYIGKTLLDAMKGIKWNEIYKETRGFGKGLADFLNGLISPELFNSLGETVAGALNTALHFVDSFGLWFDWKNFGDSLAAGLLGFLNNIQWDVALSAASNWGKGIADALNDFITPETFGTTGNAIAMALNTAIQFALSFGRTFDFKNLGESIVAGINNFFATFNFKNLVSTLNIWANGILDTVITILGKTDWDLIGSQIGEFLADIDFIAIGKKLGKALWKAINAGIKLFAKTFSKAPIETAIITLMGIPKVLKAIVDTKFVKGVKNLVTNFRDFGDVIEFVFPTFTGDVEAFSIVADKFPKMAKVVDILGDSFQRLMFGVHFGDYVGGINAAIDNIRNNLTGLQKGVITAAAAFVEFNIVSDTFEGLTLGSENLLAGIGKISIAVAAAGAAMYVALGPTGLAIAAITGVVAAVNGINDAFDAIRAQEIGESIKNAMSNPGGVPLSEVTSSFVNAFSEAASGFELIKEKSSEMDSVQKNIESTWIEIYKIQEAMDNGVLSVEEGKTKLETLFSELATLTEQKFSTMNTAIVSAYGEGGSFRTALDSLGADTEAAIDTMITYGYQNSERAKEIAQELAGMDIHSEDYMKLTKELASLTGEMSNFEKATSDFTYDMNLLQGKIDYSEIFLEDGSIDTEVLKKYFDEASGALNEYETSLDEAGKEVARYWQEIYNSPTATEDQKAIAEANLNYIPEAIKNMKTDAELKVVEFTDMLQNDFIAKTGGIIEDAQNTWNSKTDWDKFWNGVFGAGTEGEYVKEAVEQQQKNVDELSAAIEESFGDLEIDGVAWASDAAKEIYGALFDSQYIHSEVGLGHYKYTLNEDYKEIIEGATEGISELAAQRGKDATEGYANEFSNSANVQNAQNEAKTFTEKVIESIAKAQDSHSPSKVTEGLGKDAVDGYTLGIESNKNNTINAVTLYTTEIINRFSDIIKPLKQIGIDAMNGLHDGLSSAESSLYAKARKIADNITKTIKTALDIHSPSKVMFELGNYTMQGFKNGLENLYYPIAESVQGFEQDLEIASEPNINDVYGDYKQTAEMYAPKIGARIQQSVGYDKSNMETNALLRRQNELLDAILKKPILESSDIFNAAKSVYTTEAKRRFGSSSRFDPIWG